MQSVLFSLLSDCGFSCPVKVLKLCFLQSLAIQTVYIANPHINVCLVRLFEENYNDYVRSIPERFTKKQYEKDNEIVSLLKSFFCMSFLL